MINLKYDSKTIELNFTKCCPKRFERIRPKIRSMEVCRGEMTFKFKLKGKTSPDKLFMQMYKLSTNLCDEVKRLLKEVI